MSRTRQEQRREDKRLKRQRRNQKAKNLKKGGTPTFRWQTHY